MKCAICNTELKESEVEGGDCETCITSITMTLATFPVLNKDDTEEPYVNEWHYDEFITSEYSDDEEEGYS